MHSSPIRELEPPTFRLIAERASRLRHGVVDNDDDDDEDDDSLDVGDRYESTDLPKISVAKRNARERNRVKLVNSAFLALRNKLPSFKNRTKRVSKLKVLRSAINYINALDDILQADSQQRMDSDETTAGHDYGYHAHAFQQRSELHRESIPMTSFVPHASFVPFEVSHHVPLLSSLEVDFGKSSDSLSSTFLDQPFRPLLTPSLGDRYCSQQSGSKWVPNVDSMSSQARQFYYE